MKRAAVGVLLSILAATISGCQTDADLPTEGKHNCVVTPTDLVECDLAEETETAGGA